MVGQIGKGKITVEEYAGFYSNIGRLGLTVNKLNQIISMHGFVRMHGRQKNDIIGALESMQLTDPKRTTLGEHISPDEPLTVEGVRADLEGIGWNGCHVTSLKIFGFEPSSSSSSSSSVVTDKEEEKGPIATNRKRKRKMGSDRSIDLVTAYHSIPFPSE